MIPQHHWEADHWAKGQPAKAGQSPWSNTHGQGRCLGDPTEKVREMREAKSVLGLIREQRNEALESWVRSKDACPVREGAEGKGPEVVPRRRPTSPHVRFCRRADGRETIRLASGERFVAYAAARTAISFSPISGSAEHASIVMSHCS